MGTAWAHSVHAYGTPFVTKLGITFGHHASLHGSRCKSKE